MKTGMLQTAAAAILCCALGAGSAAANVSQHELTMLETAKNVEIASQKFAKSYFYKQLDIRADHAGKSLEDTVSQLKRDIAALDQGIKSGGKEEKNIAVFLSYTCEELCKALDKPYSPEVGALMIDFSESLLEGADSLSGRYGKGKTGEAAMLAEAERLTFLLERVNKYYIIHKAGFKDYNNVVQLEKAVQEFEASLAKINAYGGYPEQVKENVAKINQFWPVAKEFYLGVQQNALPVIVLASTDKLEREVDAVRAYHQGKVD